MKNFNEKIMEILQEKRASAISIAENNLKFARKNKNFSDLEKKEAQVSFELAVEIANNNIEKQEKLRELLNKIIEQKNNILKTMGLTLKSIEPQFSCKICNDTGKNNCKCKNSVKTLLLLNSCGLSINDLKSFDFSKKINDESKEAFDKIEQWCKKFPDVKINTIFISGGTGTGKTFISKCIVKNLIEKQIYVIYTTAFSLNKIFIDSIKDGEILNNFLECEVLIIDDLGTEPIINNITINNLYLIINERLVKGKATIINSNLYPNEILDRYGERIFSRILNKKTGLAIKLDGKDLRIKR